MIEIGSLAFATPWLLAGLLGLPLLIWLLRVTPPAPRRIQFPALRFLFGLQSEDEASVRTPWWLLLIRTLIVALVIVALAEPFLNASNLIKPGRQLVAVIDDGWAAAPNWDARIAELENTVRQADRQNTKVTIATTAPNIGPQPRVRTRSAAQALSEIRELSPKPWTPDRLGLLDELTPYIGNEKVQFLWFSDGLDHGDGDSFLTELSKLGDVTFFEDPMGQEPLALLPPVSTAKSMDVSVVRPSAGVEREGEIIARSKTGRALANHPFRFEGHETRTQAHIELPLTLRNDIARFEVQYGRSAGTVFLLDDQWQRPSLGLVTIGSAQEAQPLLSEAHYIRRAIGPFVSMQEGNVGELVEDNGVIILSDAGVAAGEQTARLNTWVKKGGFLVRFAGPRLAASEDALIPIRLRYGGRALGGALSWDKPQKLDEFQTSSPFHGLAVPDDVIIHRQVLAEPAIDLGEKTWARLADGTPLVTAAQHGKGWIILFHVTADTAWSTLPLSGLYVEMLKRVANLPKTLAAGPPDRVNRANDGTAVLSPVTTLNGFGTLGSPPPSALPLNTDLMATTKPNAENPPGLYGTAGRTHAFNLTTEDFALTKLSPSATASKVNYGGAATAEFKPYLLLAAFFLTLLDGLLLLALNGHLSKRAILNFAKHPRTAALHSIALFLTVGSILGTAPVLAQTGNTSDTTATTNRATSATDEPWVASLSTRLAYVRTGNADIDSMSEAGMRGLSSALNRRTAVEPGLPVSVNVESDELVFFPLLYWPVLADQPPLSPSALSNVDAYMKNGGTILFDTRDQQQTFSFAPENSQAGPGQKALRRLVADLDIPALEPVPDNHVLTKSFYLIQSFPGRWIGGQLWVEARRSENGVAEETPRPDDGVSSVIIGSHDWVAAWARDANGRPLAPIVPGGERQRELAMRFGVNLVMYTLTGNYKADSVHVPDLLDRLGH